MTKYDVIYEGLQCQVDSGEITLETAEFLNQIAYERYGDEELSDNTAIMMESIFDNIARKLSKKKSFHNDTVNELKMKNKKIKEEREGTSNNINNKQFKKIEKKLNKNIDKEYKKEIKDRQMIENRLKKNQEMMNKNNQLLRQQMMS